MLEHVTIATLKHIGELDRASAAAEWAAPGNRTCWSFDEPDEPSEPTPERLALLSFLEGLSHDQLVETQAAYWLGRDYVPKTRVRRALKGLLEYSRAHPDHMVSYLIGNDLARALGRTVRLLEEIPGLVKDTARGRAVAHP
jgi:hypothetical protein